MTRPLTRLILVIAIALSTVGQAAAQDRPVIFVHGFGSSGETWSGAASRLQTNLAIQAATPSLNARALYENQADDLQGQSGGLSSDAVAVGHSNGGLVARQWNRQHPLAGVSPSARLMAARRWFATSKRTPASTGTWSGR